MLLTGHCVLPLCGGHTGWPCSDGAPGEVGVDVFGVLFTGSFFILAGGLMAKCPQQITQTLVSISRFLCVLDLIDLCPVCWSGDAISQIRGLIEVAYYP